MTARIALSAYALCALLIDPLSAQSSRFAPAFTQHLPQSYMPQFVPPQAGSAATPIGRALVTSIALADIGFGTGVRFGNLGGRREIFVPLPQGADLTVTDLVLTLDDLSAYEAKRNLEVLANDRNIAAIALDGRATNRVLRIPLGKLKARDGFIKLTFVYAGAASQDRCIDVRYVGDSLTIRPETALEVELDSGSLRDVATIAALMPREVSIVLPSRRLTASEMAAGITVARALAANGRRPVFRTGSPDAAEKVESDGRRRWTRGAVVIGGKDEITGAVRDVSLVTGSTSPGTLSAIRVAGLPALLINDTDMPLRAARFFAAPSLAAARGIAEASIGDIGWSRVAPERLTFDELGLNLASVDVFGRADFAISIDARNLPPNTQAARLMLDIMVAPDSSGEKAVVSVFVNERLQASSLAVSGGPTQIDVPLTGLSSTTANVRAVIQRRSAQGDCKFEPQGYPAQILGSSTVVLTPAGKAQDFADLAARWSNGLEIIVPPRAADTPEPALTLLAAITGPLSNEGAPIKVTFADRDVRPTLPFISIDADPPAGATPRVRFDRGRVAVADRGGRTLLDVGGFNAGAVLQLIEASGQPGLWIKPLANDGALPTPAVMRLDRGDVAFVDHGGLALAMSTARDTLVRISYPDQIGWTAIAERFRVWIVGSLWLFATVAFLFALQRMRRRRPKAAGE
ncbi:MAG: hypothetical protein JOZ70_03660 [Pseudolabrys sp.]|nr:hypothetical protein [Pseudolabrys sp.]